MALDLPPQQKPTSQATDNQFRFLFNLLSDHWMMLLCGAAIGALLVGGVAWMMEDRSAPLWQSSVSVSVTPSRWEHGLLGEVAGGATIKVTPSSVCARTSKRLLAEQVTYGLVEQDIQSGGAHARIAGKEDYIRLAQEVEAKISLQPLNDERRVAIAVQNCESGRKAEQIADLAARALVLFNQDADQDEIRQQQEFLKKEMEQVGKELRKTQEREYSYKQKIGFRTLGKVEDDLSKKEQELEQARITKKETEAKLAEMKVAMEKNSAELPESLGRVTDASIEGLLQELDKLLAEKQSMSVVFEKEYPGLLELEERIAEKQSAILGAMQELGNDVAGGSSIWNKRKELVQQQMLLRNELTTLEVRIASSQQLIEKMMPQIPQLANEDRTFLEMNQETKRYQENLQRLREQEWQMRTALRKGGGNIERVESISAASLMPWGAASSQLWVNCIIGAILGLVCTFAFIMVVEINDTSIRNIEDVQEYIGLEVIGTIPKMRFGKPRGGRRRRATYVTSADEEQIDACIVTQHDPKSPISEAYRTLRTNFQFATISQMPKSLMITSAVPGEGKTTTTVNLAVTMADRGIRVLIVDTDLRRPNVHRVLRMERGSGLADVIREGLDIHDVIRSTRIDNLWVVSSGRVPPNPSELLASDQMAQLMKQLESEFDLIICDAPSVLVVTDPVLLATHVDTCIMVVSTNNARRETVIRANKLLQTAKVNVVGVVVNGLETTRRHYYYYYYYYDDGAPTRRKWYHFY